MDIDSKLAAPPLEIPGSVLSLRIATDGGGSGGNMGYQLR